MACDALFLDRRNLIISVVILGLTLSTVFLAYFSFSDASESSDIAGIKFAAFIFRHGERAPSASYANDPHMNHSWIGGFGALSPRGSLQMFNLGNALAKRYRKLLPSNGFYSTKEMYVISSAHERCLMSAQSFLAGFLPSPPHNEHNLPIKWQPIAVNSIPRDRDTLIAQKANCSKYDKLLDRMYNDPPENVLEFLKNITELFDYCRKHADPKIKNINQLEQLHNILLIQEINGLKLPEWSRKVFPEQLLPVTARNLALLTETDFMKRIKGGSFVTNIHKLMESKEANTLKPDRDLFIFSGHDVSLINIMRALNITTQTAVVPDFGAALYFELHENQATNQLEVKIFYSSSADHNELKPIAIPNCDAPCLLTQFRSSIDSIYVTDYEKECQSIE